MYTCLDCGREPEEEQQWDQEVMKWNGVYCFHSRLKMEHWSVAPAWSLSTKILPTGLFETFYTTHKIPEPVHENILQRSQFAATSLSPRLGQTFISRNDVLQSLGTGARVPLSLVLRSNAFCWRTVGGGEGRRGVCWLGAKLLPSLSSTSYWCPGLEVSPSGVSGSNFIWWIWSSTTLRGPSGQTYWNPNKWACGEGPY